MEDKPTFETIIDNAYDIKRAFAKRIKQIYDGYRNKILDRDYINRKIAVAIAGNKSGVLIFTSQLGIGKSKMFEKAQNGFDKSIIEELREMYPKPFLIVGYTKRHFVGMRHGIDKYEKQYYIKIKWNKKKLAKMTTIEM